MFGTTASDHGGHRSSNSTSGAAILAAFIPVSITAAVYIIVFVAIRNKYRKIYAPRTFLGTVPDKDRTPASHSKGSAWFHDFRKLPERFVLQHNSLDAYLFLRFLKFIISICALGCLLTWPILIPINAYGGGTASQLDRITFSNVVKKNYLWAHTVIAWVFFGLIFGLIAWERLRLIGTRQAYFLSESHSSKLSAKTVLFLNVPREALLPENIKKYFGNDAERSWPVKDSGDLSTLVEERNAAAYSLESAEMDLILRVNKDSGHEANGSANGSAMDGDVENGTNGVSSPIVPKAHRPVTRSVPVVGSKEDAISAARNKVVDLAAKIDAHRAAPSRSFPEHSGVFVSFHSQAAAHRAFQQISFKLPQLPIEDRYLAVTPKEVLWRNLAMPIQTRLSKASLGLAFVIAFTIFFSIPVGIIGTISNVEYLADRVKFLSFVKDLPPAVLGLLTGLLPPLLVSQFVSYVPKIFRHIAKLSGEPTVPQAELKTQAWYFFFQVFQIFLITTFSSGAASVIVQIVQDPSSAPALLAESLPKASNFYLTYFIIQGLTKAADNVLNYSDLLSYLFYQSYLNKTPRQKFQTYAQMRGMSWGAMYPKFTNLLVIAIAYACVAPLVLGFAVVGLSLYYLSYRYNWLYACQTKIDTKGEAYKRALQQMMTGVYIGEVCLIGLFGARKAATQSALMVVLLVITAALNLVLDRVLRPLELYLGVDKWQEMEIPLLADEDNIPADDMMALHTASHNRRLGLIRLPRPTADFFSRFFDSIITSSRDQVRAWLTSPSAREDDIPPLSEDDMAKAYVDPAFTSKTPKLWLPRDKKGVSKVEIGENEGVGIPATDEGAEVDEKGDLKWETEFESVPIWKKPTVI